MEGITTAVTAFDVLERVWKRLESARERAQTVNDADLKKSISDLYDEFLAVKSAIIRLTDENAELRRAATVEQQRPAIRQVGQAMYYFVGGEGPFCQPCYDNGQKLVNLTAKRKMGSSGFGRQCLVCHHSYIEDPAPLRPIQVEPFI